VLAAAATWNNAPVAVKIITHSSADDSRISQELALSLSFDHPNLVRALHFTKLRINPGSGHASLVSRVWRLDVLVWLLQLHDVVDSS
jgi:hypothetical protein